MDKNMPCFHIMEISVIASIWFCLIDSRAYGWTIHYTRNGFVGLLYVNMNVFEDINEIIKRKGEWWPYSYKFTYGYMQINQLFVQHHITNLLSLIGAHKFCVKSNFHSFVHKLQNFMASYITIVA